MAKNNGTKLPKTFIRFTKLSSASSLGPRRIDAFRPCTSPIPSTTVRDSSPPGEKEPPAPASGFCQQRNTKHGSNLNLGSCGYWDPLGKEKRSSPSSYLTIWKPFLGNRPTASPSTSSATTKSHRGIRQSTFYVG